MRLKLKTVSGHLEANDPCLSGPHWERLCLCISYPAVILKFKILFQRSHLYIHIIRWLIPWRIFVGMCGWSQLCKFGMLVYERELGDCRLGYASSCPGTHSSGAWGLGGCFLSSFIASNLPSYLVCWLVFSRPPVAHWS